MSGKFASDAHTVLQYLISKAMLEGRLGQSVAIIPMTDMVSPYEGPIVPPDILDLVLKINISTEWISSEDALEIYADKENLIEELTSDEVNLGDEEDEPGYDEQSMEESGDDSRPTNKDKKSSH